MGKIRFSDIDYVGDGPYNSGMRFLLDQAVFDFTAVAMRPNRDPLARFHGNTSRTGDRKEPDRDRERPPKETFVSLIPFITCACMANLEKIAEQYRRKYHRKDSSMKQKILVLMLLLALTSVSSAVDRATGSYADAKSQAAKLGKPLLIDFFTEW